jgi:hypothetical protein
LQFKWDRLTEKFASEDTLAGKRAAIEEYLQTIATGLQAGKIPDIDLGLRVNQISKIIGLSSREINAELSRRVRRAERAASYEQRSRTVPAIDYGQGLFAAAQREVLEVLLNEPALYASVRQKITAEAFDVPILKQAATILFEALKADANASLREILARAESVELGKCVMELAQAGQEKGNFESRLAGAMKTMERSRGPRQDSRVKTADDLRRVYQSRGRENPHSVGMVE